MVDSGRDGSSGADCWMSIKLFLEETSAFKQQNPGKFCLLMCSLCFFMAVLGSYIPGVVISYTIVLGVLLWPVMSSHELGMWFEPVLQKLDFGLGPLLQRIKESHEKRLLHAQAEKESVEADLSSLFPQMDSTACKEMCVSDTEVSDVTWTDNATFNLSEGHTPQTENSEERRSDDDAFSGCLAEFPSLDTGTNGEDDDDDPSIGLPPAYLRPTTATQERPRSATPDDTDSECEDFELLDQSELEHLEGEPCLENARGPGRAGFFSKLLGQQ